MWLARSGRGPWLCRSCRTLRGGLLLVALALMTCVVAGCSVLIRGTSQGVPVSSVPAGATVIVDGEEVGTTPVTVALSRSTDHTVVVKRGTQQRTITLHSRGPDGEAIGIMVAEAVPGTAATVLVALSPCPPASGGLCEGVHSMGLFAASGSALLPVIIDLSFESYDHLEPDKVMVDF